MNGETHLILILALKLLDWTLAVKFLEKFRKLKVQIVVSI